MANRENTSKLKLPKAAPLPQPRIQASAAPTRVGQSVLSISQLAAYVARTPRIIRHGVVIGMVGAVVMTGSTGHPAKLNPLANQVGYGSTALDQASATNVAAKVAEQTDLLVTQEVDTTAKTLNEQVSLPTSDDATLAERQVVDTTGAATRGITNYDVKPGDTLSSIAANFGITSDTIRWANNLSSDSDLKPGQSLKILPISGVQYTVKAGDTAEGIASKFQSNADQIIAFNNAEVDGLQSGATIIVPDGVIADSPQPATPKAPAAAAAVSASVHVTPGGPNSYAFGYCTWYVATRRAVPSNWGNANAWYSNAQISGYSVGSVPRVGAIAWTGAGYYGHVAYVESVSGGNVTVSEMNWNGNWDRKTFRTVSASAFRYIY